MKLLNEITEVRKRVEERKTLDTETFRGLGEEGKEFEMRQKRQKKSQGSLISWKSSEGCVSGRWE